MSRIAVGARVRVKGTKIEGVAGADETLEGVRRIRVDHGTEGGDNQHWANEDELEVVGEDTKSTAPAPTRPA